MWLIYAFLSAIFAALVAIFAKIGLQDINADLGTAIRTTIVLFFTWGIAISRGTLKEIPEINSKTIIFLILSGLATGLSWLFYFRAIQLGRVSQVVPVDKLSTVITIIFAALILREKITLPIGIGIVLMTVGTIIVATAK
jgi:transporter family protein